MRYTDFLASFNLTDDDLLGAGGEAQIYALDERRIVRLFRAGATSESVTTRTHLLAEIAAGASHLPFETPVVLEQGVAFGRLYTIEQRIAGTSLHNVLNHAEGAPRRRLIAQYMETAWQLGTVHITRPFVGEIGRHDAIQTTSWHAYLAERAQRSLTASPLSHVDANPLAAAIPDPVAASALVHLDYFAGNVMVVGEQVNAIIDFGYSSIIGDRRMNALVAAAHLSPAITPTVTADDLAIATAWLHERDLYDYYQRGLPWLAAYWTFANDDIALFNWCCSILQKI